MVSPVETSFRTCPLCEAGCGVAVGVRAGVVESIRGDADDVFSRGYLCPKATALGSLHHDPDRLRRPMIRESGRWTEVSFDTAFAYIERALTPILREHGRDAVGVYLGNPNVHNLDAAFGIRPLLKALGSRNIFTASTLDQRPKEVSAALMFGTAMSVPIPDIDRTDYLLVLGANPLESNGSLATAPDWPGRLAALRARGGRLVVVDPRRTRTAAAADEHVALRPGTDALLLAAIANTLYADGLVRPGAASAYVSGLEDVRRLLAPFTPHAVAPACGIDAATIARLAHELARAPTCAVYGRMGTTTQAFGTLASWLVDVCNTLVGALDRPGGVMWTTAAAGAANTRGTPGAGRGARIGRYASRVRGLPETFGELPAVCMTEEMVTPGPGQIRALVTIAGNPVLSAPDAGRFDAALAALDLVVAVDIYLNETTRHANVILPPPSQLQRGHYDLPLLQFAVRNIAHYSPPSLPLEPDQLTEYAILMRLALIARGLGATADFDAADEAAAAAAVESTTADPSSRLYGCEPAAVLARVSSQQGPERLLDVLLRAGPYGAGLATAPDAGLSLDALLAAPHGIDLGPLRPRLPEVLRTPSGRIELAPAAIVADLPRLEAVLGQAPPALVLVGRRHLRSNNSWLHNVHALVKGAARCTLQVHPDDAARAGVADGARARVTSATGSIDVVVEVTPTLRPGVASLPHGWGHDYPGVRMGVASAHAGVNTNVLTDGAGVDAVSGTAVLNGIPIEIAPLPA